MKKVFFILSAGLLCIFTSCDSKTDNTADKKDNSMQQKNMAASDAISKAFQTGDASAIDSVVSEDFIDHTERGDMKGRDSLKAMVKFAHDNFKDMKAEKVHALADDDYVYSWMHYTGTSDGTHGNAQRPLQHERYGSNKI